MFTEALDSYQALHQAAQFQMVQNASLSLCDAHVSSKNETSSKLSDTLDMKKQKCLLFMGHIYRRMNLYDNSMQCYKSALLIQKRLFAANAVDISRSGTEMGKKSSESDLMLSKDFDLNIAITDALFGIGLLYADKNHSHSSTRISQRYLKEAAAMKQQLVPSSSIFWSSPKISAFGFSNDIRNYVVHHWHKSRTRNIWKHNRVSINYWQNNMFR